MRLYICGPMTGLPEFNFPAFNVAALRLNHAGYETTNPADNGAAEPGLTWGDYMRRDIPQMLACDGIALLPSWENSRGALLETHIAAALDMDAQPVEVWLDDAAKAAIT